MILEVWENVPLAPAPGITRVRVRVASVDEIVPVVTVKFFDPA
jgi:hypothetical protein